MNSSSISPKLLDATAEFVYAHQISQWKNQIPGSEICARQRYRIASVKCDAPVLILPLQGIKRLHFLSNDYDCNPGEFLMLHGAVDVRIENIPAVDDLYRAWAIGFPWRLIELARQLILNNRENNVEALDNSLVTKGCVSENLLEALRRHMQLLQNAPSTIEIDLSQLGILAALHRCRASGFLCARDPSLAARIRMMVCAKPQYEWCSTHFEETLHLSGATLRRRLADEGTSLRQLIREARLHVALTILQTQKKPIKVVASECGYRSVTSFRESFIELFGITPDTAADH